MRVILLNDLHLLNIIDIATNNVSKENCIRLLNRIMLCYLIDYVLQLINYRLRCEIDWIFELKEYWSMNKMFELPVAVISCEL